MNSILITELESIFKQVFEDMTLEISSQTTASDIKEWNSLNHMQLIMEIENYFSIEFTFDEVVSFKNVGDIERSIKAKQNNGL